MIPDYDAWEDARQEYAPIRSRIKQLRARAGLHHLDPDALDEDEQQLLEELEEWEP